MRLFGLGSDSPPRNSWLEAGKHGLQSHIPLPVHTSAVFHLKARPTSACLEWSIHALPETCHSMAIRLFLASCLIRFAACFEATAGIGAWGARARLGLGVEGCLQDEDLFAESINTELLQATVRRSGIPCALMSDVRR